MIKTIKTQKQGVSKTHYQTNTKKKYDKRKKKKKMRTIQQYIKIMMQNTIEERLMQQENVIFIENDLSYFTNKERDKNNIMAYYHIGFETAGQWGYASVQLTVYHHNWWVSHFGISWEQDPVYVNTIEALTTVLSLFAELPFSIYCDKVTFDWQEALRDLDEDQVLVSDDTLDTYLRTKEWALRQRIGNHRYRIFFPEQVFRTLEDTLFVLSQLNQRSNPLLF